MSVMHIFYFIILHFRESTADAGIKFFYGKNKVQPDSAAPRTHAHGRQTADHSVCSLLLLVATNVEKLSALVARLAELFKPFRLR